MKLDPSMREAVLAAVPSLRAFAISLSGNVDRADDLVQETLLRALVNIDSFEPSSNMPAIRISGVRLDGQRSRHAISSIWMRTDSTHSRNSRTITTRRSNDMEPTSS